MDATNIELCFADLRDAQAIAYMSRDLIEAGLGWSYRRERIVGFIRAADTVVLMARRGRQRVGFAVMTFGEQRAHLVLMAVYPAYQRRGVGQSLVEWLVESARVAGVAAVEVELRADNRAALGLYARLGFEPVSRVDGYYSGRETALRMVRILRLAGVVGSPWRPPTHDSA
ncbi:MAG: GNAT family N-acetyltransferase [Casimicrobiaceae bacterium]